jgi:MFS family permease
MQRTGTAGGGLGTALDIAVAPRAAFAALRDNPTWGWAFLIAALLGMLGAFAIGPIVGHAAERELQVTLSAAPQVAQLPPDQRQAAVAQQISLTQTVMRFSFLVVPVGLAAGCALQALIMLAANAIGGGDGTFRKFWALAVNAAVIGTGIASIAMMAIVLLRGAGGFGSAAEIANSLPGLGTFVPPEAKAAAAFLGVMNVFAIWNMVLLAAGMMVVARLRRGTAIATVLCILAGTGLVPLIGALMKR